MGKARRSGVNGVDTTQRGERRAQVVMGQPGQRVRAGHGHDRVAVVASGIDRPGVRVPSNSVASPVCASIAREASASASGPASRSTPCIEHDRGPHIGRQRVHVVERERRCERGRHRRQRQYPPAMSQLARISWLVTVGICLIAALILLLSGYNGYAGVVLAVAIAAGINLF